jgi:hypothetical protein
MSTESIPSSEPIPMERGPDLEPEPEGVPFGAPNGDPSTLPGGGGAPTNEPAVA